MSFPVSEDSTHRKLRRALAHVTNKTNRWVGCRLDAVCKPDPQKEPAARLVSCQYTQTAAARSTLATSGSLLSAAALSLEIPL